MEKLKEIIQNNRMSTRPEFYSGRGAIMSDLNSTILSGINKSIKEVYGDEASENFITMVENIKVLSATTFLEELYSLFYNGWKYNIDKEDASGITVGKDEKGEYDIVNGMMGIISFMCNDRDQTNQIRNSFLQSNNRVVNNPYITDNMPSHKQYYID